MEGRVQPEGLVFATCDVQQQGNSFIAGAIAKRCSHLSVWQSFAELNTGLAYEPATALLNILPNE